MPLTNKMYNRVPHFAEGDEESSDKLLADDSSSLEPIHYVTPTRRSLSFWLPHVALFSIYTVIYIALYFFLFTNRHESFRKQCLLETSLYSPVHEVIRYSTVRFNGSLDFPSGYSGHPTPEIDKAWDRITTHNALWPIRVSDEELDVIHKADRPSNVRYSESDGGGSLGTVEVFHQLHCLNLIRKYTYLDQYPDVQDMTNDDPKLLRRHLDHCIEIMRQNLMCNADVGIISYDWIKDYRVPFPDFNTYHRCRNFDDILNWVHDNQVHIPNTHMHRLGDEVDLLDKPV